MNADNMVKTGNNIFAIGCLGSMIFWIGIPTLFLIGALFYSLSS